MTQPLLSILMPNTTDREEIIKPLIGELSRQTGIINYWLNESKWQINEGKNDLVQIVVFTDDKSLTIGEKRELMYKMAIGKYSWQIDSDDSIAPNAIQLILEAIRSNPDVDVISFEERVRLDGIEYKSNHSNEYGIWEGDGSKVLEDGFHFHRTIFFKDVIRTELAKSVPIVHCRYGEDNIYADDLKPFIKSESHINHQLYYYNYISTPHNERYGIKEV